MSEGYTVKEMIAKLEDRMEEGFKETNKLQRETNGRVRTLEGKWAYITGIAAAALALGLPNLAKLINIL